MHLPLNKRSLYACSLGIMMILFYTGSNAQSKFDNNKNQDPIKNLSALVGKWEGKESWETGPVVTNKEFNASYEFTKGMNGMMLMLSSMRKETGRDSSIESTGMIAFDTSSKLIHIYMADNKGETFDLAGKWTNYNTLNFTYDGTRNPKMRYAVNLWLTLISDEQIEIKSFTTIGENLLITSDAVLNKVAGSTRKK